MCDSFKHIILVPVGTHWINYTICCTDEVYTAEEGDKVSIGCEGFFPDFDDSPSGVFVWYKAPCTDPQDESTRVADYNKSTTVLKTYGDLKDRATIDHVTGALHIVNITVTDEYIYTCFFYGFNKRSGFKKEMVVNTTGIAERKTK